VVEGPLFLEPVGRPRRSRRARAFVAALMLTPVVAAGGVELGGLRAVNGSVGDAQRYVDAHAYERAVAVYRAVASETGPLYLLAHNQVDAAEVDARRADPGHRPLGDRRP
jgi:hypothetical protein